MVKSESDLQSAAIKAKHKAYAAKCMADGGQASPTAEKGRVRGPGGPTDDKIDVSLSNGEYVLPASTVQAVGVKNLDALKAATHTPAKGKFGMADGGWAYENGRISEAQGGIHQAVAPVAAPVATGAPPLAPVASPALQSVPVPKVAKPINFGASLPASAGTPVASGSLPGLAGQGAGSGLSTPNPIFGSLSLPATAVQSIRQTPQYADGGMVRRKYAEGGRLLPDGTWEEFPKNPSGVRGYTVTEQPMETIDYSKTPSPRGPNTAPVAEPYPSAQGYSVNDELPKAAPNAGMRGGQDRLSPQGAKYQWQQRFFPGGEPIPNTDVNGAATRPAVVQEVAPAAEAAPAESASFGQKAKAYVKNLGSAAVGKPATAVAEPASASRGWLGKGAGLLGAGVAGYNMSQEGANAGNVGQMVGAGLLAVPHPLAKVAGLALSFGAPAVQAAWDSLKAQGAGNVEEGTESPATLGGPRMSDAKFDATNPKATAASAAPSPKLGELTPVQQAFLSKAGVSAGEQNAPLAYADTNPDARGDFVRSPQADTKYQNLGDYSSSGTKIFGRASEPGGRINDFVGAGPNAPTSSSDNGITFGITPQALAAYRAERAQAASMPQMPAYQPIPEMAYSPETQKVQAQIVRATRDLTEARGSEKAQIRRNLVALNDQHQTLAAKDIAAHQVLSANAAGQNAANQANFGHAMTAQQQRLSMNNAMVQHQGNLELGQAQLDATFKIKEAEMKNAKAQFTYQHGQDAIKKNEDLMDNYAATKFPGDEARQKQYAGILKMLTTTRGFQGPDGKPKSFHEFNAHDRGLLMGDISKLADYNLERMSTGKPMDPTGQEADRPASLGETTTYALRHAELGLIPKQVFYGTRRAPDGTIIKNPDLTTSYSK